MQACLLAGVVADHAHFQAHRGCLRPQRDLQHLHELHLGRVKAQEACAPHPAGCLKTPNWLISAWIRQHRRVEQYTRSGVRTKVMDRVIVQGLDRDFLSVQEDGFRCDRPCTQPKQSESSGQAPLLHCKPGSTTGVQGKPQRTGARSLQSPSLASCPHPSPGVTTCLLVSMRPRLASTMKPVA